jgi:hypothetical protein
MDRRKILLYLAIVLFVGWLAYLIHLGLSHHPPWAQEHPTVISRPQILVSQLIVVAHLDGEESPNEVLKVTQVLFPSVEKAGIKEGEKIRVLNMPSCTKNWSGAGDYLVPLDKGNDTGFVVTSIPRSPGFNVLGAHAQPLIYRWTQEIEAQFQQVPKPAPAK